MLFVQAEFFFLNNFSVNVAGFDDNEVVGDDDEHGVMCMSQCF